MIFITYLIHTISSDFMVNPAQNIQINNESMLYCIYDFTDENGFVESVTIQIPDNVNDRKHILLKKLERYRKKGFIFQETYDINSSISDMEMELQYWITDYDNMYN